MQDTGLWKFTYVLVYPALLGSMIFEALDHAIFGWDESGKTICLVSIVILFCLDFWIVHKISNEYKVYVALLDLLTAIFYRLAFVFVLKGMTGWSAAFLAAVVVTLSIIMYYEKINWRSGKGVLTGLLAIVSILAGLAGAGSGYLVTNSVDLETPFLKTWKEFSAGFGYGYLQIVLAGLFFYYLISIWRTASNRVQRDS